MNNGNFVNVQDEELMTLRTSLVTCEGKLKESLADIEGIVNGIIGSQWSDNDSIRFRDAWIRFGKSDIQKFTETMTRFQQYLQSQHDCLLQYHQEGSKICSI